MNPITLNFKLPKEMRDIFKATAKKHGTTMQTVLFAMTENYIENAGHLTIRIVDKKGGESGQS